MGNNVTREQRLHDVAVMWLQLSETSFYYITKEELEEAVRRTKEAISDQAQGQLVNIT